MTQHCSITFTLDFSFSFCNHRLSLQSEATLHLICDHFSDGEGGGGCRRGSVTYMKHPTAHFPDAAVKHKVIHEISVSVESLSSNSCRTPGGETTTGVTENCIESHHLSAGKPSIDSLNAPCNKHMIHVV